MLELIVLGKIPGTTIVINIVPILLFLTLVFSFAVLYFLFRRVIRRAFKAAHDMLILELISL